MGAIQENGWTILFHVQMVVQLEALAASYRRALAADPATAESKPHAKLLAAVAEHIHVVVPADPADRRFEQGKTIGPGHGGWRRVKFYQRFRLFFRFHSKSRTIVFAWLNDEKTLRARGTRNDVYQTFRRMLDRDDPPSSWDDLVSSAGALPEEILAILREKSGRQ